MLRDINLKDSYRTDNDDLIRDFYIPCFSESNFYQRAVGYFSSSALSIAAKGIYPFIQAGGRMQLIASPFLSDEDIENIRKGYIQRRELELKAIEAALSETYDDITEQRLSLLSHLIENNRLDVKIAVLKEQKSFGIYHEKLGLFSDGKDFVAFTGSPNESQSGLVSNFENIDVFCSWRIEDEKRAAEKQVNFQKLWDDQTKFLSIIPFPEAARRSLLKRRLGSIPKSDPEEFETVINKIPFGCPRLPDDITLRPYQRLAINRWFEAGKIGTFKMATGSGKTITSLALIEQCFAEDGLKSVIILAPYKHLVSQWARECERFGLQPICCFESRKKWSNLIQAKLYSLQTGDTPFVTVITTNSTFSNKEFQSLIEFFPKETLLIGDEAHNLGARKFQESLPGNVKYRLALSATPERWFDEDGTEGIFSYFGPKCIEFTLKDALDAGALVPYRYSPIFVELTDEEAEKYKELSKKIARAIGLGHTENGDSSHLTALLNQRARLVGSAQNKLLHLKSLMSKRLTTTHTLFYCGDGSIESELTNETETQINAVTKMLGYDLGYRVEKYIAETQLDERNLLKMNFDNGNLQGLVAIRCLDEGVDIPSIRTAVILASSSNPRQFIQRRGRVLRRSPGKEEAEIFDMIVLPPNESDLGMEAEKSIVKREIDRYMEFARLSINFGEVRGLLAKILDKYDLL